METKLCNDKMYNYTNLLLKQFLNNFEQLSLDYNEENKIKTILSGKMLYNKIVNMKKETKEAIDLRYYLLTILNINLNSLVIMEEIKEKRK